MHKFAKQAAAAALAANEQGKFWEYSDQLFANYRTLSDAKLKEINEALGLDSKKFSADFMKPAIQQVISGDIRDAVSAGVRGTPAIFLNGRLVRNRSLQTFQTMIDEEMRKGAKAGTTKQEQD